jgi:tight adherence protein B
VDGILVLIALSTGGAVALASAYGFQRYMAPRAAVDARLRPARASSGIQPRSALRAGTRSRLPLVDRLPLSAESREKMRVELQRAGDPLSVNEYLGLRAASGAAAGLVGVIIAAATAAPPIVLILLPFLLLCVGWFIPRLIVSRARRRRQILVEEQLPDALTAIAKSLRAGTGILQGLAFAAAETPEPLGPELALALRDLQLGADPEQTFTALAERVGNKDLDIAVTAIVIQRTVGGNLSEILTNVTRTIRDRAKVQAEIRVLTARQKLQGNLVAALPIVVAVLFIAMNPDTGKLLIDNTIGRISLAMGIVFELIGLWLIRRLGVVDY